MKTKYTHIEFHLMEEKPKTTVWKCVNKKYQEELGIVKWYPNWRKYCYFTSRQRVYSPGCIKDLLHFVGSLNSQAALARLKARQLRIQQRRESDIN